MFRRSTNDLRHDPDEAQREQQRSRAEAWLRQQKEGTAALLAQERAMAEVRMRRQMEARAARKAAEEFQHTPYGQAVVAFDRGDRFLQLELSHAQVTGSTPAPPRTHREQARPQQDAHPDLLGQIEAVGWRLVHANWVYAPNRRGSQDTTPTNGSQPVGAGQIVGIYLFHRDGVPAHAPVQQLGLRSSNGGADGERHGSHRSQHNGG
jgi:hypothetical protein